MDGKIRLELIYLKRKDLKKYGPNPRKLKDKRGIEKLRFSIREHGFQNPLQVWKNERDEYEILCGNHRFEAALQEGMIDFPCIVYQGTKEMAAARVIADNKSSEWTEYDVPKLKELLIGLDEDDFDMALTGFDVDEIDKIIKEAGSDPDSPDYPIVANFSEKYDYVVIFCKNEIDNINLQETLQCRKESSYKSKSVGMSRVITFERFMELWQSR